MVLFSGTFDTTNALAGMFLWLIFGFLSHLINCDLQRFLLTNPYWIHFFGIVAFFFLFALVDNNSTSIGIVWIKTILVYILFIFMTKARWFFAVPILILLLITQSIQKDVEIKSKSNKYDKESLQKIKNTQEKITAILQIIIIVLIFLGTFHYIYIQYIDHHKHFSLWKFFFKPNKCRIEV
jgi:hypothetical protein